MNMAESSLSKNPYGNPGVKEMFERANEQKQMKKN